MPLPRPHRVRLTYFKRSSGKFYTEGFFYTRSELFYEIVREVRARRDEGRLPGLASGGGQSDFIIHMTSRRCAGWTVPHLIV